MPASQAVTLSKSGPSKAKTITVFIITLILGFVLFALPNIFFGVSKINGGLIGINLLWIALFQLISVTALLAFSLKKLGLGLADIGLRFAHWKADALLGMAVGISWAILQFAWLIPATGGSGKEDISQMLSMYDGSLPGLLAFLALGVIGGGITEELYNRGFFISILQRTFPNKKTGLWVASLLSVLFFALGHLPNSSLMWFDILVPTIAYTLLFLFTRRLTAPIIAHAIYNLLAILATYSLYYHP